MRSSPRSRSARRSGHRLAGALLGAVLVVGALAGPAAAREITSGGGGGGGGGGGVCSPVSSLTAKGDARLSDLNIANIDVSYSVKPCVKDQAVTVRTEVVEAQNPAVVVWDDANSPLSGKFTLGGLRYIISYRVTVYVYDATTGALAGKQSAFVGVARKVGV